MIKSRHNIIHQYSDAVREEQKIRYNVISFHNETLTDLELQFVVHSGNFKLWNPHYLPSCIIVKINLTIETVISNHKLQLS